MAWDSKRRDPDTGLLYYWWRHYKPEYGRWLGRDPIQERGGYNLYSFVLNDSINTWDVWGLRGPHPKSQEADYYIQEPSKIKGRPANKKKHPIKYHFRTEVKECVLNVIVDIKFVTAAQTDMSRDQKQKIREGIKDGSIAKAFNEGINKVWNDKFKLCCKCEECQDGYEIKVKINPITVSTNNAWKVGVTNNPKVRSDQLLWNYNHPANRGGARAMASLEMGHMLGFPDEYLGPLQVGDD